MASVKQESAQPDQKPANPAAAPVAARTTPPLNDPLREYYDTMMRFAPMQPGSQCLVDDYMRHTSLSAWKEQRLDLTVFAAGTELAGKIEKSFNQMKSLSKQRRVVHEQFQVAKRLKLSDQVQELIDRVPKVEPKREHMYKLHQRYPREFQWINSMNNAPAGLAAPHVQMHQQPQQQQQQQVVHNQVVGGQQRQVGAAGLQAAVHMQHVQQQVQQQQHVQQQVPPQGTSLADMAAQAQAHAKAQAQAQAHAKAQAQAQAQTQAQVQALRVQQQQQQQQAQVPPQGTSLADMAAQARVQQQHHVQQQLVQQEQMQPNMVVSQPRAVVEMAVKKGMSIADMFGAK